MRLTTEVLIIGYVSSVILMPGGNLQFQFWYISLVPLLVEMVGLQSIFTFWIYAYMYPVMP
jgi:hypothetical protein